jgi:demethylmenaquinone methyltransferase / 2-methoxy-6-polyprenyl-1,4-benzoquinol methylase
VPDDHGLRRVPPETEVRAMFDSVARRYDLLNDVLSLGLDRWWRRATARAAAARPGDLVLDLGCGTGRLGGVLAPACRVVGVDLSAEMLQRARRAGRVLPVQGSAFHLPFRDGAFDRAVSGFVLRNLDDLPGAFAELGRVLAPGGTLSIVDITEPAHPRFRRVFDAYFRTAGPALGRLAGQGAAYRYLVGSLGQLPPPDAVVALLEAAGFAQVAASPRTGGMVTLFTARRQGAARPSPPSPPQSGKPLVEGGTP